MTILVTGGMGYIGSHTCVELLERDMEVVIVDNLCNSKTEAMKRVENITVAQHGGALPGRAGEHDHGDAVLFPGAARSGAPVVDQHGAALRQHGLLEVVLRHLPAGVDPGEVVPDALGGAGVKGQLPVEAVRQHVFGQVVAGGAEAAGGDNQVSPALGDLHRRPQPLGVIPHHGVIVDVDAQGGHFPGDHLGVGVGDAAQQQLGAYGDELGGVRDGGHQAHSRAMTAA